MLKVFKQTAAFMKNHVVNIDVISVEYAGLKAYIIRSVTLTFTVETH